MFRVMMISQKLEGEGRLSTAIVTRCVASLNHTNSISISTVCFVRVHVKFYTRGTGVM